MLKMLDCFCGLGGVSDEFTAEGFDVLGLDVVDMPKKGYKHKFMQTDIRTLKISDLPEEFQHPDVIWGSPPCRDFTRLPDHGEMRTGQHFKWKVPKNPENGLKLVSAFLNFIDQAQPRFWVMENVANLANYIDLKPLALNSKIWGGKRHVFYSNLTPFLIPTTKRTVMHEEYGGPLRSWERARIPLACSRSFAQACKSQLLANKQVNVDEK